MLAKDKISEQEAAQIAMYESFYQTHRPQHLAMVPADWEKIDRSGPALSAYIGSVRALGNIAGKSVLDIGCGDGWLSVILAKRGALVTGVDISEPAIEFARKRAEVNNVKDKCSFHAASAYELPVEASTYDLVIGQAILHHVESKARIAQELYRVMRPQAKAVFAEPFGNSATLEQLRRLIPVKSGSDDPLEWKNQFKYSDAAIFRDYFDVTVTEYQFFSRLERVWSNATFTRALGYTDLAVLRWLPFIKPLARSVVIELLPRRLSNG